MNGRFKPRMDILPPAQRRLWPELGPITDHGFVLYGGTAIALRLGHRTSVDFDFFSDQPLDRKAVITSLPFGDQSTVLQDEPNSLTLLVSSDKPDVSNVKVSFFGAINFGRVGNPDRSEDGMVCSASLDDLMASKVKVIAAGRGQGLPRHRFYGWRRGGSCQGTGCGAVAVRAFLSA